MRRIGLGTVAILVVLGVVFGGVFGGVVGAVVVNATSSGRSTSTPSLIGQINSRQASLEKVPVTNAVSVVKQVGPAVVTIEHRIPPSFGLFNSQPGGEALGSGFIVDRNGDIVTNAHVISGASHFTVIFANGRKTSATLVGENTLNDVAVVHIKGRVPAVAHFGNSGQVQTGEPVIAIGNALGQFQNTVTEGIVSGLHRNLTGINTQDMIQTDAAINHGNSGGPLLDLSGRVIGMNTAIDRSANQGGGGFFGSTNPNATVAEGLGFAIPSNTVAIIAEHIIAHIPPPYLGVRYESVNPVAESYGVPQGASIQKVVPGAPAAKAGIHKRDVITAVNGRKITNSVPLEQVIATHKAGDTVRLRVWRSGKFLHIKVTLGKAPSS